MICTIFYDEEQQQPEQSQSWKERATARKVLNSEFQTNGLWFVALQRALLLHLQFANVSIWKSRKNRDYLRIIPFYFIFSFIFFPFLSVWNAPLNFVFLCSFLHGTLIFCLLFALILMYTYLFARLFAHGNKNRWTSTTENQMRTCT